MGIKMSALDAQTILNNTDIMHLRTTGGLDKKITGLNVKENSKIVTIEDAVSERDPIVMNWGRTKYYKANSAFDPWNAWQLINDTKQYNGMCVLRLNDNQWLHIRGNSDDDTLWAMVITVDEDGVCSIGTPVIFATRFYLYEAAIIADNKFAIIIDASDNFLYVIVGTISGTTITMGTAVQVIADITHIEQKLIYMKENYFVIGYCLTGDYNYKFRLYSVTGTVPSQVGSELNTGIAVSSGFSVTIAWVRENLFAWAYRDNAGTNAYMRLVGVTDAAVFHLYNANSRMVSFDDTALARDAFWRLRTLKENYLVLYKSSPTEAMLWLLRMEYDGVLTGTENDDAIFPVTLQTIAFQTGSQYFSPQDKDQSANTACGYRPATLYSLSGGIQIINGIDEIIKGYIPLWGIPVWGTFVKALTDKSRGIWIGAPVAATAINVRSFEGFPKVIGFATAAASASSLLAVQYKGKMAGFAGLAPEKDYYLKADGTIDTKGLIKIGKALNATELLIDIKEPW